MSRRQRWATRLGSALACALALAGSAGAQAPEAPAAGSDGVARAPGWLREHVDLGGSLRAGFWTSSRDLDESGSRGTTRAWLKTGLRLPHHATLRAEGYFGSERVSRGGALDGVLREAYLSLPLGALDLRLGKQIIVWGRADGLNPTDSLNARDFTRLFTEDDDQRQGLVAARASLRRGATSLTGVWIARGRSDVVPASPPSARFVVQAAEPPRRQPQFALKLERTGAVDWSLSYYDGVHPFPDLGLTRRPPPIPLVWRNSRARVFGADVAAVAGRFGLRAEAAYQRTADPGGLDPFVRNPFLYVVVGADRSFGGTFNVNLQYVYRHVSAYSDPRALADALARGVGTTGAVVAQQLDPTRQGVTLRLSRRFRNDTLTAETFSAWFFEHGDFVIRPKLTVALVDHVTAVAGGDLFRGPALTFLGRLRNNTVFYSELRYVF